ncbi:MAG: activator of HSP90 ATPase [Dehalococcoidia bacterium]|nr:activator of HSP90 ATPase [Dehalococcoidia bacterium]
MTTTEVRRHIEAPRAAVYAALIDPAAVAAWRFPDGMSIEVHAFEPRKGGAVRVSLTYEEPDRAGKTSEHTDSYHGRIVELVPDQQVVEVDEFETDEPSLQGEMTITVTLADAGGGTDLIAVHEGLPPGVRPEDNELGWQLSLDRLAALVEVSDG